MQNRNATQPATAISWSSVAGVVALVVLVVVIADQTSKWVIVRWLGPDSSTHRWELAGNLLAFEYVENTGAAFGILAGRVWLLLVLALLAGLGFLIVFWNDLRFNALLRFGIGLVLGGAAGNLLDRVRLGYVVDFMAAGTWPKFNVADSSITIGLILLAISTFTHESTLEHTE